MYNWSVFCYDNLKTSVLTILSHDLKVFICFKTHFCIPT